MDWGDKLALIHLAHKPWYAHPLTPATSKPKADGMLVLTRASGTELPWILKTEFLLLRPASTSDAEPDPGRVTQSLLESQVLHLFNGDTGTHALGSGVLRLAHHGVSHLFHPCFPALPNR